MDASNFQGYEDKKSTFLYTMQHFLKNPHITPFFKFRELELEPVNTESYQGCLKPIGGQ